MFNIFRKLRKLSSEEILTEENIIKYIKQNLSDKFTLPSDIAQNLFEVPLGSNTKIIILQISDSEKYILRIYPLKGNKKRACYHYYLAKLLMENDISVPKIILFDESKQTEKQYQFEVIVEEFINGRPLVREDLLDEKILLQVNDILKKQHSIKSSVFGRTWMPRLKEQTTREYFEDSLKVNINKINEYLMKLPEEEIKKIKAFFEPFITEIEKIEEFELSHNDFTSENLLLDQSGKVVLIDFGAMSYFFFENDLINLFLYICQEDESVFLRILDKYFDGNEEKRKRFFRFQEYFLAYYFLEKTATNSRKSSRFHRKPQEELDKFKRLAQQNWTRFNELGY